MSTDSTGAPKPQARRDPSGGHPELRRISAWARTPCIPKCKQRHKTIRCYVSGNLAGWGMPSTVKRWLNDIAPEVLATERIPHRQPLNTCVCHLTGQVTVQDARVVWEAVHRDPAERASRITCSQLRHIGQFHRMHVISVWNVLLSY